jgi:hypothetical protein
MIFVFSIVVEEARRAGPQEASANYLPLSILRANEHRSRVRASSTNVSTHSTACFSVSPTFSAIVAAICELDNAFAIVSVYSVNPAAVFKPLATVLQRENRPFPRFSRILLWLLSLLLPQPRQLGSIPSRAISMA